MSSLSRKRGVWYLWIEIDGKRKGISLGTKNRNLAKVLARTFHQQEKPIVEEPGIGLKKLFQEWLTLHSHFSQKYLVTIELMWQLFITATLNWAKHCNL